MRKRRRKVSEEVLPPSLELVQSIKRYIALVPCLKVLDGGYRCYERGEAEMGIRDLPQPLIIGTYKEKGMAPSGCDIREVNKLD